MPTPRKDEDRNDFMQRCVPQVIDEGRPQDQAVAMCNQIWRDRKNN